MASASDQLRRVGPDGREEVSLAVAFELGRTMAAAQPGVIADLLSWRAAGYSVSLVVALLASGGTPLHQELAAVLAQKSSDFSAAVTAGLLSSLGANALGPVRPASSPPSVLPAGLSLSQTIAQGFGLDAATVSALLGTAAAPATVGLSGGATAPIVAQQFDELTEASFVTSSARAVGEAASIVRQVETAPTVLAPPVLLSPVGLVGLRLPATLRAETVDEAALDLGRGSLVLPGGGDATGGQTMIVRLVNAQQAVRSAWAAVPTVMAQLAPTPTGSFLPDGARSWLAALRLLSGVPFQHLVPDTRLLPMESVRFFFVDRGWTDALIQGALSVGAVTDADRAVLAEVYPAVRDDLDQAERTVRVPGGEQAEQGTADVLTGMLMRSQAVSGWPGLHVRAYGDPNTPDTAQDDPSRLHIMRLEQLAASVLLVIFDGTPAIVHIDEPRHGIQFGVDENAGSQPGAWSYQLTLRPNASSGDLTEGPAAPLSVPFRANAPGVIDMTALQAAIAAAGQPESATMFALQMIRLPYRQVLGPLAAAPAFKTVFEASIGIATMRSWPGYEAAKTTTAGDA